jgi:hypothetical protein
MRDMTYYVPPDNIERFMPENPYAEFRTILMRQVSNLDLSAAGTFTVYSLETTYRTSGGAEIVNTLHVQATQDAAEDDFDFSPEGLPGRRGERMVIRHTDAGTIVTPTSLSAYGLEYRYR